MFSVVSFVIHMWVEYMRRLYMVEDCVCAWMMQPVDDGDGNNKINIRLYLVVGEIRSLAAGDGFVFLFVCDPKISVARYVRL